MSQTPAMPSPSVPLGSARMRHHPLFVRYAVVALIAVLLFIPLILVEDLIEGTGRSLSGGGGGHQPHVGRNRRCPAPICSCRSRSG
ncbi:MAG: hypothetical protein V8Q84_10055 [Bilophila sp.]